MADICPRLQDPSFRFVLLGSSGEALKKPIEKAWTETANYPYTDTRLSSHRGNIGVCGGFGDLLILDSDDLPRWVELGVLDLIPSTLTIESRPGHRQFYVKCPERFPSGGLYDPERTDTKGYYVHIGDAKGTGGQAVAPGSEHPTGSTYQIVVDAPIATVTPELVRSILQKFRQSKKPNHIEQNAARLESMGREARQRRIETDPDRRRRYAEAALQGEVRTLAGTPEGGRNVQLNDSAFALGQFVGAGDLDEGEVIIALSEAAEITGLDYEGIRKTIISGLEAGKQKPREIPARPTTDDTATAPEEISEPKLQEVSKDDPNGAIGLNPITGHISKVLEFENESGEKRKFLGWVSDCAVHIHTETRAKDETEFIFVGIGAADKRNVKFTMKAGDVMEGRKFRAALTNAFGAKNKIGKLTFPMVQELSLSPQLYMRVEAPMWKDGRPLLPGLYLSENVEYRLIPQIPAAVYDGDVDAAKDALRTLLKVHKYAPLVVDMVLGAPAIARGRKNDRFGLGVWGLTGTLKTSTLLAAMGVYGTGYLDAPMLKAGKDGSTSVGAMEMFAAAGFLPQPYDNLKAVNPKDIENYVGTMHAVLEGHEKARGKKDGGLRESREFLCTPIVTGEVRPQEASTTARVLNLNWTQADGNLLGEVQSRAALLPVIGYTWLRFLADTEFVLGKDFEAFRNEKTQEFLGLKYTNPGRLATIYSLLVSVWDLLEASPLGDVFIEARESFKAALQEAITTQGAAVGEETEISRFLSGLEELLAGNPNLIQSVEGKKTIAGAVIGKWMPDGIFLLPTETLNELMKIRAFNQQPTSDSITQGLSEKDLLLPDPDGKHLKYRMRFNGGRPWGWYVKGMTPQEKELSPPGGDAKNDNSGASVPTVPMSPPKKKENILEKKLGLSGEPQKQMLELGGDSGDSGDRERESIDIDIDFDSKVSVPSSVPTNQKSGDSSHSECGIGPHPRKDDPGLSQFKQKVKAWSGRHTCAACGQHFDAPLVVASMGGFICEPCRRGDEQLTAKLEQTDSQTRLADTQAT